jgi:hypothetical protein
MDWHRWSSLLRRYDLRLRHNQLILVLSAAGGAWGFLAGARSLWPGLLQAGVAAAVVFVAAALAKEIDPDGPASSLFAAALGLPFLGPGDGLSPVALFWLLGCLRLLNRSTGLRPKASDILALLAVAAGLAWQLTPLFGPLMGGYLVLDGLLPDGAPANRLLGAAALLGSSFWLYTTRPAAEALPPWQMATILVVAIAFIGFVILRYYHTGATGDVTGEPLLPARVQAGQAAALTAGLALASALGEQGVVLLAGLWAALLGVLLYHLVSSLLRRSAVLF